MSLPDPPSVASSAPSSEAVSAAVTEGDVRSVNELADEDRSGDVAPPVVVVMVTHDPGWWFDETLESVALQDYPALTTLIVDTGSADADGLRQRIAAVLPDAHVRRLPTDPGFGAAANEVLDLVEGAAFHLVCHDDVRLAPDAVRLLVEEAFRSNAGIVGPKVVEWSDPRRLLSVGMGADRFGQPAPYVERGDLDQEQHDAVRDVMYIPGAVTLVRADLFAALGGFDPEITFHGDDLDLSWRAHVAGARVIVAPSAVVAHLEALGLRRPVDDRRRLQTRHRMRAMRVAQSLRTRVRTTPELAVLAVAEMLQAVILGHFRRARDVGSAWLWNARHRSSTISRRRSLESIRRVSDGEVHAFQSRGSARLSGFLRSRVVQSEAAAGGREFVSNLRSARSSTAFIVWLALIAYLLAGSRELIFGGVPAVGQFVEFLGPGEMISRWTDGWQSVGLGSTSAAPTGFGIFGLLSGVLFGASGLLRSLLILGLWPLGVVGIWRLTRPFGSSRTRLISTVVYTIVPIAPNAIAQGQWGTLAVYAALPWIVAQVAAASALAPFGPVGDAAGPGVRERPLRHRVVLTGLLVALAMVLEPAAAPVVVAVGLLLTVGGVLAGQLVGAMRMLIVAIGAVVIALVLHLPWSLSFLDGWDAVVGTTSNGGYPLALADVLRFGTGPQGTGLLGWSILATAALVLFIGRRWRLGWAVRSWTLAAAGFAVAWAIGRGLGAGVLPSASVVLVISALGIALAAGLGMAAFESDLPDYHFGWRQLLSLLAAAAFVVALGPALGAGMSGRWAIPRGEFDRSLSFLDDGDAAGVSRVLWLGDATALPLSGWRLDAPTVDDLGDGRTLAYATTMGGTPTVAELWAGAADGATDRIAEALRTAADGGTARLGALLAPMGIREIVIPLSSAPDPYAQSRSYMPTDLLSVLDAQLDLASITTNPGVRLYRNSAWAPVFSQVDSSVEFPQGGRQLVDRTSTDLDGAPAVLTDADGFGRWSGTIESPSVIYAGVAGSDWTLQVGGVDAQRSSAFGWASSFVVESSGDATISYSTPTLRRYLLFGQVLLWIAAIMFLLRGRVRIDEHTTLIVDEPVAAPGEASPDGGGMGPVSATEISDMIEGQPVEGERTEAVPSIDPVTELLAAISLDDPVADAGGASDPVADDAADAETALDAETAIDSVSEVGADEIEDGVSARSSTEPNDQPRSRWRRRRSR